MGIKKGIRTIRAALTIIQAIRELQKQSGIVYSVPKAKEDYTLFYRSGIYHNLNADSFFEYLKESHTKQEIMDTLNYTDEELLKKILHVLVLDNMLIQENTDGEPTYHSSSQLPEILKKDEIPVSLSDVGYAYNEYLSHLIDRLKGNNIKFAMDFNVFNWIGGFRNIMYPTVTKGSLAYCQFLGKKVLKSLKAGKKVKILDAGSGDGRNTIILWNFFRKKGCLAFGENFEFNGIDYSEEFVEIANFETFGIIRGVLNSIDSKFAKLSKQEQDKILYSHETLFPTFKVGDVENLADIPDNDYDLIFTSNTLHWTNIKKSIPELLRITKPGGVIFGQGKKRSDKYGSVSRKKLNKIEYQDKVTGEYSQVIFNIVNPEASGFPYIDEFTTLAKDNGAKTVEVGMPSVGFFFIVKREK